MKQRLGLVVFALTGLAGCLNTGDFGGEGAECDEELPCGTAFVCVDGVCTASGHAPDMGSDSGQFLDVNNMTNNEPDTTVEPDTPIVPCGGECGGETPVCDEASDTCVACLADDECLGDVCLAGATIVENACVECRESNDCASGVCDTDTNTCVACLGDADCNEADAARCQVDTDSANNACVACDDSSQCAGIAGAEVCGSDGTCVECTDDDDTTRATCGGNSCDPATNLCTQTPIGQTSSCEPCVADSECVPGHRCVPLDFMGVFEGNYCLETVANRSDGVCPNPYKSPLSKVSVNGEAAELYCGIAQNLTSCPAVVDMVDGATCASSDDCGDGDGECPDIPGLGKQCSVACDGSGQCTSSLECSNSVCNIVP